MATDNIQSNVRNGKVACEGSTCSIDCDDNYQSYGGPNKVKCKQHTSEELNNGIKWTKQIGRCETCNDLNLNEMDDAVFKVIKLFRTKMR